MTVSIRRMSLGTGFEYLMKSVARGDGAAMASSPLTRYYAESGTPPGRFLGSGLAGLNRGAGVAEGSEVTEQGLWRMLGMLADPATGDPLGRRPKAWPASLEQRIAARVAELPGTLLTAERDAAAARIRAEESAAEARVSRPVAAFDLTFSAPKSVSTLWALADPAIQEVIHQAHRDALRIALSWAEHNVLCSRSGKNGINSEPIRGVVAAAFDHWDSRAGDPHLHTHLVIANRAQCADGTWRALDSRTLFRYTVALSELHEGVLADLLTDRLGFAWTERARKHSAVPRHDIAGVPEALIDTFSTRSHDIDHAKNHLIADFARRHGRQPTTREILQLRQQATLETRPDKQHRTLGEQMTGWRARAAEHLGSDPASWARRLLDRNPLPPLTTASIDPPMLAATASLALDTVATKRATFSHANVLAEVHRQLQGVRFASPADRLTAADHVSQLALGRALLLTDSDSATVEVDRSVRRAPGSAIYTTQRILDAETRLLDAGRDTSAPRVPGVPTSDGADSPTGQNDRRLGQDQAAAVHAIATSGRTLDLLLGPAGTGKTTALAALRHAWEAEHGAGSVIGLAPSAAAADNLADGLGIATDNTAKWLTETRNNAGRDERIASVHADLYRCADVGSVRARRLTRLLGDLQAERDRWTLQPRQLLIVDEAGLAGTLVLDELATQATGAGAKLLLVGDFAQLGAIDAGGALAMLAADRTDVPTLTEIRRFHHDWERAASRQLRVGAPEAVAAYLDHDRVHEGNRDELLDQVFAAWQADSAAGLSSLMIATDRHTVAALNARAQSHRLEADGVDSPTVPIAGGAVAADGDRIVTRANDRRLAIGGSWVKNGDTWTVRRVRADGSLDVERVSRPDKLTLPADYVRCHVELGYATTTHGAQGRTVDTAHALIDPRDTRETLYVAATRARQANHLYVDTAFDRDPETHHETADSTAAPVVLRHVLDRTNGGESAHVVMARSSGGHRLSPVGEPARQAMPAVGPQASVLTTPWSPPASAVLRAGADRIAIDRGAVTSAN